MKKELLRSNNKKKVLVAISGGVDSAVAAKLLLDEGYEVSGVYLDLWKDEKSTENKKNDIKSLAQIDAEKVATKIGIPLHILNYRKVFKEEVVDNFLKEYASGKTPNPCVVCNKKIKIASLIKYAKSLKFDYLATGHYLSISKKGKEYQLFKAKDTHKDQTYFLYTLSQEDLKHLLFPLGAYKKSEVKKIASKHSLGLDNKPESQDICFIPGAHNDFLKKYLKLKAGPIKLLDSDKTIAKHQGLALYTIGQRRGIEIGGSGPYYVAAFDYDRNILYVVQNFDESILYKDSLVATNVNFLSSKKLEKSKKCQAVIRYGHRPEACELIPLDDDEFLVNFKTKQRAIAPGQSVVFYDKNKLLGGGIIK